VATATTPIPPIPTISAISNQTTLVGISAGPFPFYIADPGLDPSTLAVTATSSNTNLLPEQSIYIGNLGATQSLVLTPAAGQTGTSTITITVSNGFNSTNASFLLTVNPPGGGTGMFANTSDIVIPSASAAAPYPSTITIAGETGTITNVEVTLQGMSHSDPTDVNVLLVGPGGQAVVLMSDTTAEYGGGVYPMTNVTFTLSDQAYYPLPPYSPMADGTFQPADFAPNHTNSAYAFPSPAPAPPFYTLLGTYDGLSPNGTWSLYVSDGGADDGGEISGGWSLAIMGISPLPAITSIHLTGLTNALLTGTGTAGVAYTIQASSDFINWQTIGTATAGTNRVFVFIDPNIISFKSRCYRVVQP